VIYVMGDGLVLEQGTHDELLSRGGAYAALVQSQKLREVRDPVQSDDDDSSTPDEPEDMEKLARDEVPLGRKNTGQSLASEILEQKRKVQGDKEDSDHSLSYLFKRMGKINRVEWRHYLFGGIAAASM
jgi:ATP-binding cassette subfamily B (MDR/TAP) protein 1